MPKILITGLYDPTYPRNRSLINSFKKKGEVTEWPLGGRVWSGIKLVLYLAFSYRYQYAVIIQPAHFLLPFLLLIKYAPGRPKIILDAFISIYDTNVSDRNLTGKNSLKAKLYKWLDKLTGVAGEGAFFDTLEHQAYFNLPAKVAPAVIPVVPDYDLLDTLKPDKKLLKLDKVNILFYGKYIPLQGVGTIIEAAKILSSNSNLHFTLIGGGQDYKKVRDLAEQYSLNNITFHPRAPYQEIIAALKGADLTLGVFGASEKMQRVIPNKVLEALAVGTPLITGESAAVKRFFKDNEHLFFVPPQDPAALAQKITEIASDLPRAKQIALSGQQQVKQEFNQGVVLNRLTELLAKIG